LEQTTPDGTSSYTEKIPFSEDGKATYTREDHVRGKDGSTIDLVGTGNVTITPATGGYRMDFGTDHTTGTSCGLGQCQSVDLVKKGWATNIVPADPGECPQP
jgi:hypothetical protein